MSDHLKRIVEAAWEARDTVSFDTKGDIRDAVYETIDQLDRGVIRVAGRSEDGTWTVNQWTKQAILLYFRLTPNYLSEVDAPGPYWDKIPLKFAGWDAGRFEEAGFRAVPGCIVRKGSALSMGTFITSTTPIIDRRTGQTFLGEVPPYSVIVPGSRPNAHDPSLPSTYCAVIMKTVDERTRSKTSINELLRD